MQTMQLRNHRVLMNKSGQLKTWERQYYEPGGGDAFLFYAIFGEFQQPLDLSQSKYRSRGVPQELKVGIHRDWLDEPNIKVFIEGYLGEMLAGMPDLHKAIRSSPECIIIAGTIPDPANLNYLRDTVGFITALSANGAVGVYDPQRFAWWSPATWTERIFLPNAVVPRNHCIILVSEDSESSEARWIHTRGLRKFGRPDISVRGVRKEYMETATEICNRLIDHQAFGLVVPDGQAIRVDGLPDGIVCRHAGDLEDPDFNNVHIEIRF